MWKLQFQQMENHPQRLKDCESFWRNKDISQMVLNLNEYRKTLKGDFEEKSREWMKLPHR
jgi:hypothetical protein